MLRAQVQTAFKVLFPPSCAGCGGMVDSDFGVCGACWRELPLISGTVCHQCGVPLLEGGDANSLEKCDDCMKIDRPWTSGRAAMRYSDLARKMVLGLKHGDRHDIAVTCSTWMAQSVRPLLSEDVIFAPVPLHWSRLLHRRYNQSALLAQNLALKVDRVAIVDLMVRHKKTKPLDGVSVTERFARLHGAIGLNPSRAARIDGKHVIIVDDVMTSGATLSACAKACIAAGAQRVDVQVLARVCKDT